MLVSNPRGSLVSSRPKRAAPIAFHDPQGRLHTSAAGVFDFTQVIYADAEAEAYLQAMERSAGAQLRQAKDKVKFYRDWRTFQISDHLPLWLELKTDFSEAYLAKVMREARGATASGKPSS
jgi:hypothetical protein